MNLAKKLFDLRKQKRLSQLELAEKLGVSRQAISRWEVGAAVPTTDNLKCISKLYSVSMDYLLDDHIDQSLQEETATEEKNEEDFLKSIVTKKTFACICILIFVASILLFLAISHGKQEKAIIPIGEMEVEEPDNSPSERFSLEW